MPVSAVPGRPLFLLAILTLVWGTNWPLFVYAVSEVSVWTFRAIGLFGAGFALLLASKLMGLPLAIPRRYWKTVFAAAIVYLFVWNVASTYAAILLPSGQSAILGFTMPLWSAIITWGVLREPVGKRLIAAIALGALAVLVLMIPSFQAYASAPAGLAWGLAAAIGWAAGTLILKRGRVDVPAPVLTAWQLLVAAVPITIGALVLGDHQWFMPSTTSIIAIAYITLVPMSIGNVLWFSIVGLLPANVAGISSIMVPMVAMVSGAIVHGEPLGPMQWFAMALCAASLWLALLKPPAPPATAAPSPRSS